jgi:hypothetical protein
MPRFLNTEGNASIAIFVCDRCKMKRAIVEAMPDPNFPGLKVCQQGCADNKDPYRLPARKTEKITLQYPRPDVSLDDLKWFPLSHTVGTSMGTSPEPGSDQGT